MKRQIHRSRITDLRPVPVQLHRDEGDDHGHSPGHANHNTGHPLVHTPFIAERAGDGPVSVHANDAQIEDGGRGTHDVEGQPSLAESSKRPETRNLSHSFPGHHQHRDQEVRQSQGHDEDVGYFGAQVPIAKNGCAHREIAKKRPNDK